MRKGAKPSTDQLKKFYTDELAQGYKRFEGMFKTAPATGAGKTATE